MSKAPKVKNWVKWYIRVEALKNRAEPRDAVAERIEAFLEHKERIPCREYINKKISSARNSNDPEDSPWSVVDLANPEYAIPPEAVPIVLRMWASEKEEGRPLTIRQALWVARLYHLFCIEPNFVESFEIPALAESVKTYASLEKAVKDTGGISNDLKDIAKQWELYGNDLILLMRAHVNRRQIQTRKRFTKRNAV